MATVRDFCKEHEADHPVRAVMIIIIGIGSGMERTV
jgi:hypothetical protein